jgi:Ser/Thr protein kinase RdoA (MazF antagonist)
MEELRLPLGRRIGEGRVAEVFEHGEDRVLKLYRAGQPKTDARREAAILDALEAAGVAAPRVFDVAEFDGRWGLVMSRVDGDTYGDQMRADPARLGLYLTAMAKLQVAIHAARGDALASLKVRAARKIEGSGLADHVRRRLRDRLSAMPDGDRILHGDYHPYNVLGTLERAVVVDWLDATAGLPAADLCRSWLLIQAVDRNLADAYVEAYLAESPLGRDDVFVWVPILAAARLAENVPEETDALVVMAEAG